VLKIGHQRRVDVGDLMPPAAVSAHTVARQSRRVEIVQATSNRRARKPCDFGNRSKTATPGQSSLRPPQTGAVPLVELRAERLPSLPNRFPINHAPTDTAAATLQESQPPESLRRSPMQIRFSYF
jgi:hypothetical protein